MAPRLTLPAQPEIALSAWRAQALNIILYIIAGVGGVALLGALPSGFAMQRYDLMAAVIGGYLVLFALAFLPRLGFTLRAGALLFVLGGLGVLHIRSYSLLGDGREYLMTCVVLAGILFGPRVAISLLVLGALTMGGLFAGFATGQFVLSPESLARPVNGATLVSNTLVFVLLTSLLVGCLLSLISRLSNILAQAQAATEREEQARHEAQARAAALAEQTLVLSRTEAQLRALVETLETPLVPLADGVVLAPIVGAVDSQRARQLTNRLLEQVSSARARLVILDIGGVAVMDTEVAQALTTTSEALRLLGCRVALTGVSPSVAITLTQLNASLHGFRIARSPQEVLS